MRGLSKVILIGRLGADPELRTSREGNNAWGTMRVATNRSRKDGENWVEETDWHRVVLFGRDAERVHQRLRKGDPIAVEGELQYESWEDSTGRKRTTPRVVARRVTFIGASNRAAAPTGEPVAQATKPQEASPG